MDASSSGHGYGIVTSVGTQRSMAPLTASVPMRKTLAPAAKSMPKSVAPKPSTPTTAKGRTKSSRLVSTIVNV